MIRTHANFRRRWMVLPFVLLAAVFYLACSEQSEQTEAQEGSAKELRAKIVYYALPG